jgi:hypothetical protein
LALEDKVGMVEMEEDMGDKVDKVAGNQVEVVAASNKHLCHNHNLASVLLAERLYQQYRNNRNCKSNLHLALQNLP